MDNKKIVKLNFLRNRINEYFIKNPNANSFIIKAKIGNDKIHWRIVKENKKYNIIEVSSNTNRYSIEEGIPTQIIHNLKNMGKDDVQTNQGKSGYFNGSVPPPPPLPKKALLDPKEAEEVYNQVLNDTKKMSDEQFHLKYNMSKSTVLKMAKQDPKWMKDQRAGGLYTNCYAIINRAKDMSDQDFQAMYQKPKKELVPMAQKLLKKAGLSASKEGKLNEVSPAFAKMSKEFMGAVDPMKHMTPQAQHVAASSALRNVNSLMGQLKDPAELKNAGSIMGHLTGLVDKSTGATSFTNRPANKVVGKNPFEGKKIRVKETSKKDKEDEVPKPDQKNKPKQDPPKEEPKKSEPELPQMQGLDKEKEEPKQAAGPTGKEQSAELKMVNDTLSGQVIKNATVSPTPNGATINLDLQGVDQGAKFEVGPGQRIVFYYKGRPTFIRK